MTELTSPLATLEQCFHSLSTGPGALTIDGRAIRHGLPRRPIPLDELRVLLHHLGPYARTAAMNVLVGHARAGSAAWLVGVASVLLPGLRDLAAQRADACEPAAAEAQALIWFRTAFAAGGPAADRWIQWLLNVSCATQGPDSDYSPNPV